MRDEALLGAEDAGWAEFLGLVESLTDEELERPGYLAEGWSVKDLIAHIGSWQAEAGQVFQQMAAGTYLDEALDVDRMNRRFHEENQDIPLATARAELFAARTRMLRAWADLGPARSGRQAEEWFVESGANHYAEHLPRLREWLGELRTVRG